MSVILPTYNEADNIVALVDAILRELGPSLLEIIVVDDDSPDLTWRRIEELAGKDNRVEVVRRIGTRCLTTAIADGVAAAHGPVVVWMDCDFSMPPATLPELVRAVEHHPIAIGSRYVRGGGDRRDLRTAVVLSWMVNGFARAVLRQGVSDYTTGFVAARREVVSQLGLRGDYGEYCIDFLHRARKAGHSVAEVPYELAPRTQGESKTGTRLVHFLVRGRKYVATVLRAALSSR